MIGLWFPWTRTTLPISTTCLLMSTTAWSDQSVHIYFFWKPANARQFYLIQSLVINGFTHVSALSFSLVHVGHCARKQKVLGCFLCSTHAAIVSRIQLKLAKALAFFVYLNHQHTKSCTDVKLSLCLPVCCSGDTKQRCSPWPLRIPTRLGAELQGLQKVWPQFDSSGCQLLPVCSNSHGREAIQTITKVWTVVL